jgi:fibronectin type 3 domain-containing protein
MDIMTKRAIAVWFTLSILFVAGCGGSSSDTRQVNSSVPAGVSATTAGANQVTLAWQPVAGATSYNLYWSTVSGVTTANGTKIANASSPYTHAGLSTNTTYFYIVTSVGSAGESSPSSQASATSVTVPAAPTGVSASGGNNQATVSWSAVSAAASYNIYWSTLSGVTKTNGSKLAKVSAPYIQTGLSANTTYYYIVTAVNGAGESDPSSQASSTTAASAGTAPATPTVISAVGGTNQATVSWNPVSGATSYNVYWTNDPAHVMKDMGATKITGVTTPFRHTNLAAGKTYAYVVTAVNAAGESSESDILATTTSALDGVALYTAKCATCHGPLTASAKKGATLADIQAAIAGNRGGMGSLASQTAAQLQAIADVLGF